MEIKETKSTFTQEELDVYDKLKYGEYYYGSKKHKEESVSYKIVEDYFKDELLGIMEGDIRDGSYELKLRVLNSTEEMIIPIDIEGGKVQKIEWYNEEYDEMEESGYIALYEEVLVKGVSSKVIQKALKENEGLISGESVGIQRGWYKEELKEKYKKVGVLMFIMETEEGIKYLVELNLDTYVGCIIGAY